MPRTADYLNQDHVKNIIVDALRKCMDELGLVAGDTEIDMIATQIMNDLGRGLPRMKLETVKEK